MSRNQEGEIRGHNFSALDNSLQIALAHMVEILREECRCPQVRAELDGWAVSACVRDLGIWIDRGWPDEAYAEVRRAALEAVDRVRTHGAYETEDVATWSLGEKLTVTGGFLRVRPFPIAPIVEVLEAFAQMLEKDAPPVPPGEDPENASLGYDCS